ncbi:MAG: hypothetical protein ACOX31_08890 [Eubacteriales bacterium]|jgi:mannitol-1-phosphate 5-dehydrogenase
MKAVMYGAGNIGRGFIAKRFYLSKMHTVFIDINTKLVEQLNAAGRYPIYETRGDGYVAEWVENALAINGREAEAVAEAIATADIMATSLGVNVLPHVAPLIASGIELRYRRGGKPLNILICENLIGAEAHLRGLVGRFIPEELKSYFEEQIGFVSASICITVPPTPETFLAENPLAVCTDAYRELPVDLDAFRPKGAEPPEIDGMVARSPFGFFIERKLLIHNMGHALMAYLGWQKKINLIYDIACDGEIKYILTRALLESARALAKKHGLPTDELVQFVEDLMVRFENRLLVDDVFRVGRDPARKLSAGDRLGGAFKLVREVGGVPAHIAVGIAAGLLFDHPDDPIAQEVSGYAKDSGVAAALEKYCSITDPADVRMIETFYELIKSKAPFSEFVGALSAMKNTH